MGKIRGYFSHRPAVRNNHSGQPRPSRTRSRSFELLESRALLAGDLELVSAELPTLTTVVPYQLTAANAASANPAISADGRYAAFASNASNLVAGDSNGYQDVFVKDMLTGIVTRVSVASGGGQGNRESLAPSISANGRYVAFISAANSLVPNDNNGVVDVFVKDLLTGSITLASADTNGVQANGAANLPSISADGRYVAFISAASNLMPGDANSTFDVFVKDLQTGTLTPASTTALGAAGNGFSDTPSISADGRYVVFASDATNFVAGDANLATDIFRKDLQTGAITRVNTNASGDQANENSFNPAISGDGKFVAFASFADNLVPDIGIHLDIFVKNLQTGAIARVSTSSTGLAANQNSYFPTISGDGRYVAFDSDATNLVGGDANTFRDLFVKDTQTGVTTLVSSNTSGLLGNGDSSGVLSGNGRTLAIVSASNNWLGGDNPALDDIFVKHLDDPATDVTAYLLNGNLLIQGNNAANLLRLDPGAAAGEYTLVGESNPTITTKINGQAQLTFAGVTGKIILALQGGNDVFSAKGIAHSTGFLIDAGQGNNNVAIGIYVDVSMDNPNAPNTVLNGVLSISGGDGVDTVFVGRLYGAADQTISLNGGNDNLQIYNAFANTAAIQGGTGDDLLSVGYLTCYAALQIDAAEGNDLISYYCSRTYTTAAFVGRDGIDTLALDVNVYDGSVFADAGNGQDTLLFSRSICNAGVLLITGAGADTALIGKYYAFENGQLVLANAGSTGKSLTLQMGNDADTCEMAANILEAFFAILGDGNDDLLMSYNTTTISTTLDGGLNTDRLRLIGNALQNPAVTGFETFM